MSQYTGTGGIEIGGCSEQGHSIFKYTKFGPGAIAYLCYKAKDGVLEKIYIRKITMIRNRRTYLQYVPMYTDSLNFLYEENELCTESDAIDLAIAYYEGKLTETQEMIASCGN